MHMVSLNVNGIRAAVRRGLLGWVAGRRPDLICLQEIRATDGQLPASQSSWETFAQSRAWLPQTIARLIEQLKARRAGEQ